MTSRSNYCEPDARTVNQAESAYTLILTGKSGFYICQENSHSENGFKVAPYTYVA